MKHILTDSEKAQLSVFRDYEIRAAWWTGLIFWDWGQYLAGVYFARKTLRKHKRYLNSKALREKVIEQITPRGIRTVEDLDRYLKIVPGIARFEIQNEEGAYPVVRLWANNRISRKAALIKAFKAQVSKDLKNALPFDVQNKILLVINGEPLEGWLN